MRQPATLVILGGTSLIASYLITRLRGGAMQVFVMARTTLDLPREFEVLDFDACQPPGWSLPENTTLISLLPLSVLVSVLPRYTGARAIVAIGSTSRFSKAASSDPADRAAAATMAEAEDALERWCGGNGTHFTLLRPTLVYDLRHDRNIARMARFIRRFRVLPLAHPATGLRQPIHADDVAKAILAAIDNPHCSGRRFNIAGAERLTYRAMAERVFAHAGMRARVLMLPVTLLRLVFAAVQTLGVIRETAFRSSVFERMNDDLVFDSAEGLQVLGYDPRPFDLPVHPRPGDLDERAIARLRQRQGPGSSGGQDPAVKDPGDRR